MTLTKPFNSYQKCMAPLVMTADMKSQILEGMHNRQKKRKGLKIMQMTTGTIALCLSAMLCMPLFQGISVKNENMASSVTSDSAPMEGAGEIDIMKEEQAQDSAADMEGTDTGGFVIEDEAKRVYRGDMTIETRNFDETVDWIRSQIHSCDGFIQDESGDRTDHNLRYAFFTARIPTDQFELFMKDVSEKENVVHSNQSMENITRNWTNTTAQIESLEKERERLNTLTEKAETVADLIAIEDQMSEIDQELQMYNQDLSSMNLDLEYSTVFIDIHEVEVYSAGNASPWKNIRMAFSDTWQAFLNALGNAAVFLIYALPWIGCALLLLVLLFWYRKRRMQKLNAAFPSENKGQPESSGEDKR